MTILEAFETFVDDIWFVLLFLIVAMGIYCTVRLKGIQFTQLREMCRVTFSRDKLTEKGKMSSFHVFCMSMANRIGVGNISGPVLAILIGGPGAIFWMWMFALLGMATSFLETTIGQIYKVRSDKDGFHGGSAYNILHGLDMKRGAMIVSVVMFLMYIIGFVSMEVCSMAEAANNSFAFEGSQLFFAVIFTLFTLFIIIGGVRRVSDLSVGIVPAMAIMWLIICLLVVVINITNVPSAIASIFVNAFSVPSAVGGGVGAMLVIGMKRGILSNEAGIGSIPNISSMADVKHPAAQGLSQSLGVLIDTIVCTLTALVVLSYGDYQAILDIGEESIPTLQFIMDDAIGAIGSYLVSIFLIIFAVTSLMTDYVIGENNMELGGSSRAKVMFLNVAILVVVFLSSFYSSDALFYVVDLMMILCGLVNIVVVFKLGSKAVEAYADYRRQRAEGKEEPEFHKSALTDPKGVTCWEN